VPWNPVNNASRLHSLRSKRAPHAQGSHGGGRGWRRRRSHVLDARRGCSVCGNGRARRPWAGRARTRCSAAPARRDGPACGVPGAHGHARDSDGAGDRAKGGRSDARQARRSAQAPAAPGAIVPAALTARACADGTNDADAGVLRARARLAAPRCSSTCCRRARPPACPTRVGARRCTMPSCATTPRPPSCCSAAAPAGADPGPRLHAPAARVPRTPHHLRLIWTTGQVMAQAARLRGDP